MMPPKSSTGSYYPSLPPPKRQKLFPSRRTSIKPRVLLPKLTKSQSTLTQLDFATPTSSKVVIDTSSDEEYKEPKSANTRKRKSKFGSREAGQSTMTQYDPGDRSKLFAKRRKVSNDCQDELDIWEDYEPEKWETDIQARQMRRTKVMPRLRDDDDDSENVSPAPEIPESSQIWNDEPLIPESAVEFKVEDQAAKFQTPGKVRFKTEVPSSQTPPSTKHSKTVTVKDEMLERSPLKERSNNAAAAPPNHVSPESQNTSMRMLERIKFGANYSPLKSQAFASPSPAKSGSAQEAMCEETTLPVSNREADQLEKIATIQDSQFDEAESIHKSTTREVSLNDTNEDDRTPQRIKSSQEAIERYAALSPIQRPRYFRRMNTVQDSQFDDGGSPVEDSAPTPPSLDVVDIAELPRGQHAEDIQHIVDPIARPCPPQRPTTIQDSQVDSDALTLTTTNSAEKRPQEPAEVPVQEFEFENVNKETQDQTYLAPEFDDAVEENASQYDDFPGQTQLFALQSTYDPAYSALDRDAARFRWTQTQAQCSRVGQNEAAEDSETDDEDLDAGCGPHEASRAKSPVDKLFDPLPKDADAEPYGHPKKPGSEIRACKPNDAGDTGLETSLPTPTNQIQHEVVEVPSSPPLQPAVIYPSQASTAVPSQAQNQEENQLQPTSTDDVANEVVPAPPFSILSSPPKTMSALPEMLSSSPLPLPPWSSPQNSVATAGDIPSQRTALNSDASLRNLVDFSLPPPPPLSSGRSKR